jgi:hypothetical protein
MVKTHPDGDALSSPKIFFQRGEGGLLVGNSTHGDHGVSSPATLDDQLLDSYSQTIAAVVRRVAPCVVNIRVLSGERGSGGGSGFIRRATDSS